jgi:hypothetical protein
MKENTWDSSDEEDTSDSDNSDEGINPLVRRFQ